MRMHRRPPLAKRRGPTMQKAAVAAVGPQKDLLAALNDLEGWWKSARNNGAAGGSHRHASSERLFASIAARQAVGPAATRAHPAVIDAERSPARARLHPLQRLQAENDTLRAQLCGMLSAGSPADGTDSVA